jgi:hypothetical protein
MTGVKEEADDQNEEYEKWEERKDDWRRGGGKGRRNVGDRIFVKKVS